MKTWLLVDANNMAYRMFHAMGELSFEAVRTGVVFGFLREIINLQDQFNTDRVVFCFDSGEPRRRVILPCYKLKRHTRHRELTGEEKTARQHMHTQVENLRTRYLPTIGYRNVFTQPGYEADDIIASIVNNIPETDEAVIISSDNDLLQLLRHNVLIFSPARRKAVTLQSFHKQWGLPPKFWSRVKSIAGCATDEIPGIPGCGEKTAANYFLGKLKDTTKAYKRITSGRGRALRELNRRVVRLPLEGTDVFKLQRDELSQDGWERVCDKLGMRSLRHLSPLTTRASRHG